jgi:hypothetical protein
MLSTNLHDLLCRPAVHLVLGISLMYHSEHFLVPAPVLASFFPYSILSFYSLLFVEHIF